jgi:hypothetical protein
LHQNYFLMRNFYLILFVLLQGSLLCAQVGIGTQTPHNSAMLDVSATDKGFLLPRLTSVQRNAIPTPENGLQVYDVTTTSIWYYNGVFWVNTQAMASVGDIKSGIQVNDHSGWVLLDGRAINSLTTNQQLAATALGLTGNIPNAGNTYLSQNGQPLASVNGANTTTLTQANLPNVNFTGTAASAGAHSHTVDPESVNTSDVGNHVHTTNGFDVNTTTNGNHTHGHNAPGGNGTGLQFQNGQWTPTGYDNDGVGVEDNLSFTAALDIYASGSHSHIVSIPATTSNGAGGHNHSVNIPATTSTTDGAHTHSVSVASGGTATPINIAPKTLSVNMFIYLGL